METMEKVIDVEGKLNYNIESMCMGSIDLKSISACDSKQSMHLLEMINSPDISVFMKLIREFRFYCNPLTVNSHVFNTYIRSERTQETDEEILNLIKELPQSFIPIGENEALSDFNELIRRCCVNSKPGNNMSTYEEELLPELYHYIFTPLQKMLMCPQYISLSDFDEKFIDKLHEHLESPDMYDVDEDEADLYQYCAMCDLSQYIVRNYEDSFRLMFGVHGEYDIRLSSSDVINLVRSYFAYHNQDLLKIWDSILMDQKCICVGRIIIEITSSK